MKIFTLFELGKYAENFNRFFVSSNDNIKRVGLSYKFIFDEIKITYMPTQVVLSNKLDSLIISDIDSVEIDELVENKISVITFIVNDANTQNSETRLKVLAKKAEKHICKSIDNERK